ncbi:MAG TPA: RloB family protein [Bacteroidales bacterium]|nr:RloB family protein [Bacteroidales bacterium]
MPKKTRALKLTDKRGGKPWLKKRGISKYRLNTIDVKKTFLITCEGQTEEMYFKSFPVVTASVKLYPMGCSRTSLVECTKAIVAEESYDEVWCVFDMDVNPDVIGQIGDYNNAIKEARENGFHTAYSNDAFELWFVLHFQYLDQQIGRTSYYKILNDRFGLKHYEKEGKKKSFAAKIYEKLINDQPTALKNAQKLYELMQDKQPYHLQNPVTLVYQLVNELNKYIRP